MSEEKSQRDSLLVRALLSSLPVAITVAGGFAVNYWQSARQAKEALQQSQLQADTAARQFEEAAKARKEEADRQFELQRNQFQYNCRILAVDQKEVLHDCDTGLGSMGAPLLDTDGMVIAIHHSSSDTGKRALRVDTGRVRALAH